MIGDQQDIVARLLAVLPTRWFPDEAPILTGLLSGLASGCVSIYRLFDYVKTQTRIVTATDIWLDIIALDFFGTRFTRKGGQSDDGFRTRINHELFRERGTRAAIVSTLEDLTGRSPIIFEPCRTTDTGGYSSLTGAVGGGMGYGISGGWGSLDLPFQCFVLALRPRGSGIAVVSGWGGPAGAYGSGAIEYASLTMVAGQVTDADIYTAVAEVMPVASIGWVRITN